MDVTSLLSTVGKSVEPYTWAEGMSDTVMRFDANTLPEAPQCLNDFFDSMKGNCQINEYADPTYADLKRLISSYEGVDANMITVTNSGDEALDILAKAFLDPEDRFIIQPPTYDMFKIQLVINRGVCIKVPLKDDTFEVDKNTLLQITKEQQAKIIFICNPNNPTGSVTPQNVIEQILKESNGIVLVDEAYREFYGESAVPLLAKYPNLVILRSFSKFAGLAGARVGYLLARPALSSVFDALRLPMGVSYLSYKLAEYVLEKDREWMQKQVRSIISERSRVTSELSKMGPFVFPSKANFILVRFGDKAKEICKMLKENNILVRDRSSKPYLKGCVRITIRSKADNDLLISSLSKFICKK